MIRILSQYVPKSFLWLSAVEFGVLVAAGFLGVYIRADLMGPVWDWRFDSVLPSAIFFAVGILVCLVAVGLYQRRLREGLTGIALRIAMAMFFGLLLFGVIFYFWPDLYMGRGVLTASLATAYVLLLAIRVVFMRLLVDSTTLKRRIMVLGAGDRAEHMNAFRRRMDRLTYHVVGFVHMSGDSTTVDRELVFASEEPISVLAKRHQIDEIVVAADDRRKGLPVHELLECKMNGIDVVDLLTHFEREHGIVKLDILHPSWLIFSEGFRQGSLRSHAKTVFDMLASLALLALTWPIMVVSAIAIWLESGFRGPILYRQTRVGLGGRHFQVLKFRSMRVDAEADGKPRWAKKNDNRITRIGGILRRSRIDELPQLFNVLRGEMSFVGPRPERPAFVEQLSEEIPFFDERHRVKPGITGWAQICYSYGASVEDAFRKLQFDLYYVKNYSVFFDLWILIQTAEVILWTRGSR